MVIKNSNISKLFVVSSEKRVILIASSFEDFYLQIKDYIDDVKNSKHYSTHFKQSDIYYYQNPLNGKQYTFQKIVNKYKK